MINALDMYKPSRVKTKKEYAAINDETYIHHVDTLYQILLSMFNYVNMPPTLPYREVELNLISMGVCGVCKLNDDVIAFRPVIQPPLDVYGWGTMVTGVTVNGVSLPNMTVGEDCVLIWNNITRTPDFDLYRTALEFTDAEISMRTLIRNSRKAPIPVVKDSKTKVAVTEALNNSVLGLSDATIVNNTAFIEQVNGTHTMDVLNITDVKDVDRLQYMSKYYDDILRRFCTLYGHDLQTSGKMAQQSIDEIQGYDSFSMIIPEGRLCERIKAVDSINRIFGTDISVDYSLPWRYNIYKQDNTDSGVDVEEV